MQVRKIDFIECYAELSFKQIKELIDDAATKGYEKGVTDTKKDRDKVRPQMPKRPVNTPNNNVDLLKKFLNPDSEVALVTKKAFEDGYRAGHEVGYGQGIIGAKPKFDPTLHVDNSAYGYICPKSLEHLQEPNGVITVVRDRNYLSSKDPVFVKITPLRGPK